MDTTGRRGYRPDAHPRRFVRSPGPRELHEPFSFAKICMSLFLGAAVLATGACARKQDALTKAMAQNVNKTTLSSKVDPDPSHDPDNVLVLDLSNGGRVDPAGAEMGAQSCRAHQDADAAGVL
jgi:hypothetical protein